jgi:poly(A) polymerase
MAEEIKTLPTAQVADLLGQDLLKKLAEIYRQLRGPVYLTGGTVRDLLMGREPADIDLTVGRDAMLWASKLACCTGGTYVPLGRDEDAARVVWLGRGIDFSSFREGAVTIEKELTKRDITINSMAVSLQEMVKGGSGQLPDELEIIDPTGGTGDIVHGCIRVAAASSFRNDPLRMLRVFRFAATLDFAIESTTLDLVSRRKEWISRPAAERTAYELDLIMESDRAHALFQELAATGLLFEIIPELKSGVGMEQPSSHHLDVFDHCLATLFNMEQLLKDPASFFPENFEAMKRYIETGRHPVQLKWAALFHDLGKPATIAINEDKGGRITFYSHDQAGLHLVGTIAQRLHWRGEDAKAVAGLVGYHMWPFHLGNVQRTGELSLKACLRVIKTLGPALPGLFLLSMADALAGQGINRPEEIEKEVAALFNRLEQVRAENVEPVRSHPPLLTGRDLIEELNLAPGPIFKEILGMVEEEHMENNISSRAEALCFVRKYLQENS